MQNIEKNKFIFTDSYRTKDLIWEAYSGFVDTYNDYKTMEILDNVDPILKLTLNKYAMYFFYEVNDFLDDFSSLKDDKIKLRQIFEKNEIKDNYDFLRKTFSKFMSVSGIRNIVKDKDDPEVSIKQNR